MKTRSLEPEIMDSPAPAEVTRRFHRDLALIHRLMGNWSAIAKQLAKGPLPRSVLDIGCGDGALLQFLRKRLGVAEVTGIDLKPPSCAIPEIPVVVADATQDPLPRADAAVSVMVLHHLTDAELSALIVNVGRSVKRFICLDPVRHPLPMVLYSAFICPMLSSVGAQDGRQSIRRAFLPDELKRIVDHALAGSGATYTLWVSPIFSRQILDIRWPD